MQVIKSRRVSRKFVKLSKRIDTFQDFENLLLSGFEISNFLTQVIQSAINLFIGSTEFRICRQINFKQIFIELRVIIFEKLWEHGMFLKLGKELDDYFGNLENFSLWLKLFVDVSRLVNLICSVWDILW